MGKTQTRKQRYRTRLCDDKLTFEECEMAILRHAVDASDHLVKTKVANSDEVARMITLLENFLRRKRLICYGGTAINNILPKEAQFYNRNVEVPDYDFYSMHPLEDAKELADLYHTEGYTEVEAKSGMHYGTFKVFVNFIPIADITLLPAPIYRVLQRDAIRVAGIRYAPANFLRMNMYLELSRPGGDVSRWEKLLKRLVLLNRYYPLKVTHECDSVSIQRDLSKEEAEAEENEAASKANGRQSNLVATDTGDSGRQSNLVVTHTGDSGKQSNLVSRLHRVIRDTLIDQGVIFFGSYASSLYGRYMPPRERVLVQQTPDFDVIAEHADQVATILVERLHDEGYHRAKFIVRAAVGEVVPQHYEIRVGGDTIAFIYEPIACHSYNQITLGGRVIKVASIDTMLAFYLAFYYVDRPYYTEFRDRILCIAQLLFRVQQRNRLEQRGLLRRFTIHCYGKQKTVEDIRAEKAAKFRELSGDKTSTEYQMWFLKYSPGETPLWSKKDIKKPPGKAKQDLPSRRVTAKKPRRQKARSRSSTTPFPSQWFRRGS